MADQWSRKVANRGALCTKLLADAERMRKAGLLRRDLEVIITFGQAAQLADRDQQAQLASLEVLRGKRKVNAETLDEREDELKDRLPLVIVDLEGSDDETKRDLGRWLRAVSFKRYRYRDVADAPEVVVDEALARRVARVERRDGPTRFDGMAAMCAVLRAPERAFIVEALEERGLSAAWLEDLQLDAEAAAAQGRNVKRAAEATSREEEAARQQRLSWAAARRAIHSACTGSDELLLLLADC